MLEVINIIEIWNSFFFYQKYILFVSIEFWECPENWKKQFHLDLDMQFIFFNPMHYLWFNKHSAHFLLKMSKFFYEELDFGLQKKLYYILHYLITSVLFKKKSKLEIKWCWLEGIQTCA